MTASSKRYCLVRILFLQTGPASDSRLICKQLHFLCFFMHSFIPVIPLISQLKTQGTTEPFWVEVRVLLPAVHTPLLPWCVWQHLGGSWHPLGSWRRIWNISSLYGSGCVICSGCFSSRWHISSQSVWTVVSTVTVVTRSVTVCRLISPEIFQGQMWTHSDVSSTITVDISSVTVASVTCSYLLQGKSCLWARLQTGEPFRTPYESFTWKIFHY